MCIKCRNKPTPPPPLPPHGLAHSAENHTQQISNEDYRPPVPPHRNIAKNAASTSSSEGPPVRRSHHHYHRRNISQEKITPYR